ncbi:transcriptional regulator [Paenibacillus sp. MMS20-IR301]|uniref:transcriptional regulator n=1 Tax=Paenibacillus sp. MMS20-IR301 TaxID=2895946 RepID=UPI0028EDF8C4|nr:transcriptional regulator [Paenibacillus sp. MMS20-IR301]WNS46277.1 transcriptional regulator [Paenibacillus sp. MMS20-IR301]
MSINQLSIQTGINSGTLSRLLSGQQPFAMSHLGLITQGMGLPKDYFYSLYVDECFYFSAPTWRRLHPFILSCAELGRLDCIEQVVKRLLDNLAYAPMLFEVAESLFQEGQWKAAEVLYRNVSTSEKYQHSERLAVCQYRLFRIALSDSQSRNLQAALLFECYLNRLEIADQLDGLKHLMHAYYSLHKWAKVDELAVEMHRLAALSYNHLHRSDRKERKEKSPEKPLYFYILYSHLMRSSVQEEYGNYPEALRLIPLYMDGSWIQEDNEEVQRTLNQFNLWGTANEYLYRVMAGEQAILQEYVEYISAHEGQIFTAVYNIIKSANRYAWNIDDILERFSAYVPSGPDHSLFGNYTSQIMANQHARFLTELAAYYLSQNHPDGIKVILTGLESSVKINNESLIIKCVDLFEQHRHQASQHEKVSYKNLIREVQELNDQKNHHGDGFS